MSVLDWKPADICEGSPNCHQVGELLKVAEKVLQGHMIKPYLLLQDSVWICWESHYDE